MFMKSYSPVRKKLQIKKYKKRSYSPYRPRINIKKISPTGLLSNYIIRRRGLVQKKNK